MLNPSTGSALGDWTPGGDMARVTRTPVLCPPLPVLWSIEILLTSVACAAVELARPRRNFLRLRLRLSWGGGAKAAKSSTNVFCGILQNNKAK